PCGYRSMAADKVQEASIYLKNGCIIGIAQASRIRCNLSAHAPQVRRRTGERRQDPRCGGLLLPTLRELALSLGELFGQLLDPAFRRGKIVGGRSCHDYTRIPATCSYGFGLGTGQPNRALAMLRDVPARWNVRNPFHPWAQGRVATPPGDNVPDARSRPGSFL